MDPADLQLAVRVEREAVAAASALAAILTAAAYFFRRVALRRAWERWLVESATATALVATFFSSIGLLIALLRRELATTGDRAHFVGQPFIWVQPGALQD